MKMRWMGATGPTHVKPLSDERAAELGAEIIGDTFIYTVASSLIIFEYYRSRKKEQDAEDTQNSEIGRLSVSVRKLEREMRDIRKNVDDLNDMTTSTKDKVESVSHIALI